MIDTVFFMASDLDRSTEWYSAHLGFEVGPRYGDWQEMRLGGEVVFALHGAEVVTPGDGVWVGFRVDDLDATVDRLGEVGIEPTDAETTETGYKRFRSFVDPDGNPFQLIEPSSREPQ